MEKNDIIKIPNKIKDKIFKLYDYNVYDGQCGEKNEKFNKYKDNKEFIIQAFGINKKGESASILITNFNPFFYIKVDDKWNNQKKTEFISHLKLKMGNYYEESIVDSKIINKHKEAEECCQ